jgi:3-oxocholest-4-en-26-oyl-CoA dehydrogenase beta subunit
MNLSFNEDQQMLQRSFRDFFRKECSSEFVRRMEKSENGFSKEIWQKMAALGWLGLMLPEEYGGLNFGMMEMVVLMEEVGSACFPSPYLSSTLAALAIAESGTVELKNDLLPKVALGEAILCTAYLEPGARQYDPMVCVTCCELLTSEDKGEELSLSGCKLFVTDAHVSDYILVSARLNPQLSDVSGISLVVIPSDARGVSLTALTTISGDKQFEVRLDDVRVKRSNLLGEIGQGDGILKRIHQFGALAKCAELIGMGSSVMEMTVDYAKERHQFGQAIARFQAVQHRCADMLMDLESSRYITYKAAWLLDAGEAEHLAVVGAKAWVGNAISRIAAAGHQIGAATAYMSEHDMTLYSRRIKSADLAFGDAAYHRRQSANAVGF